MITVEVLRTPRQRIAEIIISGHAGAAPAGEDLVCAGVSAVTIGMANAIHTLLGIDPVKEISESGFLHFHLPEGIKNEDKVNLLLEAMLLSLRSMEESYGDYIQVIDR